MENNIIDGDQRNRVGSRASHLYGIEGEALTTDRGFQLSTFSTHLFFPFLFLSILLFLRFPRLEKIPEPLSLSYVDPRHWEGRAAGGQITTF